MTRQNIQRLSSNNFYTVPTPLNGFTKKNVYLILLWFRSNRLYIFCKLGVPKNFAKFTEKYLCWSLFLKGLMTWNFIKKRIQHMYFPVNFEKFFRKTLFTDHLRMTTCLIPLFQPTFYVLITLFSFSLHFFLLLVIIAVIRIYSVCYLFQ